MPGFPHRLRRASNVSATAFALEAAITGQGLLLASPQLVRAELQAGKLVIDCNTEMPCPLAYFVVCQPSALERLIVQAFREALLEDGSIGPKSGSHFGSDAIAEAGSSDRSATAERMTGIRKSQQTPAL